MLQHGLPFFFPYTDQIGGTSRVLIGIVWPQLHQWGCVEPRFPTSRAIMTFTPCYEQRRSAAGQRDATGPLAQRNQGAGWPFRCSLNPKSLKYRLLIGISKNGYHASRASFRIGFGKTRAKPVWPHNRAHRGGSWFRANKATDSYEFSGTLCPACAHNLAKLS